MLLKSDKGQKMTSEKSRFDQELGLFLFRIWIENGISRFHPLQMLSDKESGSRFQRREGQAERKARWNQNRKTNPTKTNKMTSRKPHMTDRMIAIGCHDLPAPRAALEKDSTNI